MTKSFDRVRRASRTTRTNKRAGAPTTTTINARRAKNRRTDDVRTVARWPIEKPRTRLPGAFVTVYADSVRTLTFLSFSSGCGGGGVERKETASFSRWPRASPYTRSVPARTTKYAKCAKSCALVPRTAVRVSFTCRVNRERLSNRGRSTITRDRRTDGRAIREKRKKIPKEKTPRRKTTKNRTAEEKR